MNHESERYVPTIEETKYGERNYMKRSIVNQTDLDNVKGGEVIDLLAHHRTYVGGGRHVSNQGPLFRKDKDKKSIFSTLNTDKPTTFPEIIVSPSNQGRGRNSSSLVKTMPDAPPKSMMERTQYPKKSNNHDDLKSLFDTRRATEIMNT